MRQLDRVLDGSLRRAWAQGGGPGDQRLAIDIDSFVGEVHGYQKQGASYGYTKQLGPADSGEQLIHESRVPALGARLPFAFGIWITSPLPARIATNGW